MTSNPEYSGTQPPIANPESSGTQPPIAGSVDPQIYAPSMQFRPLAPQPAQFPPFGIPQTQPLQYFQPIQQLFPRPAQIPMPYVQPPMSYTFAPSNVQPNSTFEPSSVQTISTAESSDWREHAAPDGRIYYFNKKTKQSVWEKPPELMTPEEKANSSKVWKEFTTPEGRKYYHNRTTKESKWTIPDQQVEKTAQSPGGVNVATNPVPVVALGSQSAGVPPVVPTNAGSGDNGVSASFTTTTMTTSTSANSADGASVQDLEEAKNSMAVAGKVNVTPLVEKTVDDQPLVYATKQEAKTAFKALLESAKVESDWTWDQTMRVIVNDKRYGALRTLGERKQAFNEYLGQRKKHEADERRLRQKEAREDFVKMLEESEELTSSTRWSKVVRLFEDDERFKAVENPDVLYKDYLVNLRKKEKTKAQEEHKQNILEYRQFLETCDFIKVDSQWRKVQDQLEADERCSKLEKIDRLEIYGEYIRDLEQKEEEQKKIQKEKQRRIERINRDAFRKVLEEDVASGALNAKTHWRDYSVKVKETQAYTAVQLNTSGSKPQDLFDDVRDELKKQYHDEKGRIEDAIKSGKISVAPSTLEDFKTAVLEEFVSPSISDINLKLVFDELQERIKEKQEKEEKKRQRLAEDFSKILHSIKDITASSKWEECKQLFEEIEEYRSLGEDSVTREIFEEYVKLLQEKAKEKERKHEEEKAEKEKQREKKERRKEKEREREKQKGCERSKRDESDSETLDVTEVKEERKREKDKDRKHRKRHHAAEDDVSSDRDEKDDHKKTRRHASDHKKSRKHAYSPESDTESRHKRHKRDYKDGSRRSSAYDDFEDGELGEDGKIW